MFAGFQKLKAKRANELISGKLEPDED